MAGRLFDPKRGRDGSFPFEWVPAALTDLRAKFDKISPGWNKPPASAPPPEPEPVANVQALKRVGRK